MSLARLDAQEVNIREHASADAIAHPTPNFLVRRTRMRLIKFLAATLLLSASLQTMASDNSVVLPKDAVDSPAETLGTVIGTIGYRSGMKDTKVESASLVFRKVGSPEQGQINFQRSWMGIGGNARAIE